MRKALVLVFMLAAIAPAMSEEAGWSVQFYSDAFAPKTLPVGMMAEKTDQYTVDRASIFLACYQGGIAVLFQEQRIDFTSDATVRFRSSDGIEEFHFTALKLPIVGNNKTVVGADAQALLQVFASAQTDVPYQTDRKSGVFPVIGFQEVQTIMAANCIGT